MDAFRYKDRKLGYRKYGGKSVVKDNLKIEMEVEKWFLSYHKTALDSLRK